MNKKDKLFTILTYASFFIFCLYIVTFIIINFFGLHTIYDTDVYDDTLIAKLMWEQKSFFPEGWAFGNQFFILATPVFIALIYGICGNLNLSVAIATTLLTLVTLICFLWALYPLGKKNCLIIGLMVFLSSIIGLEAGTNYHSQLFFLGVSYYSSYIINVLLICGCLYRIKNNLKLHKPIIILSMLVTFACGMQSLRQTVVIIIPLIGYSLFDKNREIRKFTLFTTVSNVLGIILIKLINPLQNTIYGTSSINSIGQVLTKLFNCAYSVYCVTGLRWLGKGYLIGLFSLLLVIIVLYTIISIIKDIKHFNGLSAIIILMVFSLSAILFVCTVTNISIAERYLFTWYPLVAFSTVYVLNKVSNKKSFVLIVLLLVGSIYNLYYSYCDEIKDSLSNVEPIEKEAMDWIIDNDYEYVYGKWLGMGKYMYYANGKVIGGSWNGSDYFHIRNYINPQNIYSDEDNSKAVYFIYENNVNEFLECASSKGYALKKVADFGNGFIQLFTSESQLMYK